MVRVLLGMMAFWLAAGPAQGTPVLIGGGTQWTPFSYRNEAGQPEGIAVEITRRVMAELGERSELRFYPVNRLRLLERKGAIDFNYADSPSWDTLGGDDRFLYTVPYMQVSEHLYFFTSNPTVARSVERLKGARIGTLRGYTYPALEAPLRDGRVVRVDTSREDALMELLISRRVDAIALVDGMFDSLLSEYSIERSQFARGPKLSEVPLYMKVNPHHSDRLPAFNDAIQRLIASGEIERIRKRYLDYGCWTSAHTIKPCRGSEPAPIERPPS